VSIKPFFIPAAILCNVLLVTPNFAQTATSLPDCQSVESDSDGDGFGFENDQSCIVVGGQAMQAQIGQCVDTDGDGFGWNGVATCDPTEFGDETIIELPNCVSAESDSDNDGFGFENNQSCIVVSGQIQQVQTAQCIDTDGDGYGWNGMDTCFPNGIDPSPVFFNGFTRGGIGSGSFVLNGGTLSGQVNIRESESTQVNSVSLFTGNARTSNGRKIFDLIADGGGSLSFSVPDNLSSQIIADLTDNLPAANVYLEISYFDITQQGVRQDTGTLSSSEIYSPQLFVNGGNAVPPTGSFSRINANFNVNAETGDLSVGVELFMRFSDIDSAGNQRSITAMSLRKAADGETGPVVLGIDFERNVSTHTGFVYSHWSAVSQLSTENLSDLLAGNVYFSAEGADGINYQRGDFPAFVSPQ